MTQSRVVTGPPAVAERRHSERVHVFWPARVTCAQTVQDAVCFDVSHEGMALYLWEPPAATTLVEVAVELPNGYQIWTQGEVTRGSRHGRRTVGLRFLPHPDQAVAAVHAYLDRQSRSPIPSDRQNV